MNRFKMFISGLIVIAGVLLGGSDTLDSNVIHMPVPILGAGMFFCGVAWFRKSKRDSDKHINEIVIKPNRRKCRGRIYPLEGGVCTICGTEIDEDKSFCDQCISHSYEMEGS
ncbi:MAG: hypothetical protein GY710_13110 [Desulfobacteraceae bacterium]|nr:hypothetical protein [Desulfobacteraceae bacterium]